MYPSIAQLMSANINEPESRASGSKPWVSPPVDILELDDSQVEFLLHGFGSWDLGDMSIHTPPTPAILPVSAQATFDAFYEPPAEYRGYVPRYQPYQPYHPIDDHFQQHAQVHMPHQDAQLTSTFHRSSSHGKSLSYPNPPPNPVTHTGNLFVDTAHSSSSAHISHSQPNIDCQSIHPHHMSNHIPHTPNSPINTQPADWAIPSQDYSHYNYPQFPVPSVIPPMQGSFPTVSQPRPFIHPIMISHIHDLSSTTLLPVHHHTTNTPVPNLSPASSEHRQNIASKPARKGQIINSNSRLQGNISRADYEPRRKEREGPLTSKARKPRREPQCSKPRSRHPPRKPLDNPQASMMFKGGLSLDFHRGQFN